MKRMRLRWRLRRSPEDAQAWCALAAIHLTEGDIKAARAAAERGARFVRTVEDALQAADVLQRSGRLERALSVLAHAGVVAPDDARGHAALGRLALRLKRHAAASEALSRACALMPDDRELTRLLGEALVARGDAPAACEVLEPAIARAPDDPALVATLARAASAAGQGALAIRMLRRAAALEPDRLEVQLRLAAGLARHDALADALDLLVSLRMRWPQSPEVILNTASALAALDRHDEALTLMERAEALRPDQPIVQRNRGSILFGAGRYAEAEPIFEGLARRLPENAEAHLMLAKTRQRLEKEAAALESARRAMELAGHGRVRAQARQLLSQLRASGTGPIDDGGVILSGTLERVPVAQLLEFVRTNVVTGVLRLTAEEGVAELTIESGRLTAARCSNQPNLGDRLVSHGWIGRTTLDTWLDRHRAVAAEVPLGVIMRDAGLITAEQLDTVIEEQVVATLMMLVRWSSGSFKLFDAPGQAEAPVALRIDYLLLDVMRMLDEASAAQR